MSKEKWEERRNFENPMFSMFLCVKFLGTGNRKQEARKNKQEKRDKKYQTKSYSNTKK